MKIDVNLYEHLCFKYIMKEIHSEGKNYDKHYKL